MRCTVMVAAGSPRSICQNFGIMPRYVGNRPE